MTITKDPNYDTKTDKIRKGTHSLKTFSHYDLYAINRISVRLQPTTTKRAERPPSLPSNCKLSLSPSEMGDRLCFLFYCFATQEKAYQAFLRFPQFSFTHCYFHLIVDCAPTSKDQRQPRSPIRICMKDTRTHPYIHLAATPNDFLLTRPIQRATEAQQF